MAGHLTVPFFISLGFSVDEVGNIGQVLGLFSLIAGGLLGGFLLIYLGFKRGLWIFGILQAVSTLAFVLLTYSGKNASVLAFVVIFENLTAGLGTSAYAGFMASLCNRKFTATQYALFSSLMGVPRVIFAAPTGVMVEKMGWANFFIFCTLIAVPGILMLFRYDKWQESENHSEVKLKAQHA
jgi:PAT family beta-lactamase induction signal transducer AmpG